MNTVAFVGTAIGLAAFSMATLVSRSIDASAGRHIADYLYSFGFPWHFAHGTPLASLHGQAGGAQAARRDRRSVVGRASERDDGLLHPEGDRRHLVGELLESTRFSDLKGLWAWLEGH